MRSQHKRMTSEDKFARKYYCNAYRFIADMKRRARRAFRRQMRRDKGE